MRRFLIVLFVVAGCSKGPSALAVCKQIEAAGVGSNCQPATPTGIGLAAKERVTFDLAHVNGEIGQVLKFGDDDAFSKTYDAFEAMKALAGPHRYGSKAARIFVQMNSGTPADDGAKVRSIVARLGGLRAPDPQSKIDEPKKIARAVVSAPAAASTEPAVEVSPAMAVCRKLEASGAASVCKARASDDGESYAIFKASVPNAGGVIVVYRDRHIFRGVVKKSEPTDKGKHVANSRATRTLVSWESTDDALNAKIRAVVEGL